MCNFPASPSTPSADKCRVIPTANFRAKKPNWKSIHFESGRQSTHPAASIWLNSHFSTFSSGSRISAKIGVTSQKQARARALQGEASRDFYQLHLTGEIQVDANLLISIGKILLLGCSCVVAI